jgi:hypothetical protein
VLRAAIRPSEPHHNHCHEHEGGSRDEPQESEAFLVQLVLFEPSVVTRFDAVER